VRISSGLLLLPISCDTGWIETVERFAIILSLFQNCRPSQASHRPFEDQKLQQQPVVTDRNPHSMSWYWIYSSPFAHGHRMSSVAIISSTPGLLPAQIKLPAQFSGIVSLYIRGYDIPTRITVSRTTHWCHARYHIATVDLRCIEGANTWGPWDRCMKTKHQCPRPTRPRVGTLD